MENQIIKMQLICTIQALETKIDGNPSSFEYLNKTMDIENLEILRDELVIEYNLNLKTKNMIKNAAQTMEDINND